MRGNVTFSFFLKNKICASKEGWSFVKRTENWRYAGFSHYGDGVRCCAVENFIFVSFRKRLDIWKVNIRDKSILQSLNSNLSVSIQVLASFEDCFPFDFEFHGFANLSESSSKIQNDLKLREIEIYTNYFSEKERKNTFPKDILGAPPLRPRVRTVSSKHIFYI